MHTSTERRGVSFGDGAVGTVFTVDSNDFPSFKSEICIGTPLGKLSPWSCM